MMKKLKPLKNILKIIPMIVYLIFQNKSVGCFYTDAKCAEFIAGYDERFNDIPKEFKSCIDYDRLWNSFYRFDYTQYGKYYLSDY